MFSWIRRQVHQGKVKTFYLVALACLFGGLYVWQPTFGQLPTAQPPTQVMQAMPPGAQESAASFEYFAPLRGTRFSSGEKVALFCSLLVALASLAYAGMLVGQVVGADQGTQKMKDIAAAVREG